MLVRVEEYHKLACANHRESRRIADLVADFVRTENGRLVARRCGSVAIWKRPRWKNDPTMYLNAGAVAAVEALGLAVPFGEEVAIEALPRDLDLLWGWDHGSVWE